MERDTVDYYRARERAECEAALNAACEQARRAHAQMAKAYALLIQLHELRRCGALPADKVANLSNRVHEREETAYGRRHTAAPGVLVRL